MAHGTRSKSRKVAFRKRGTPDMFDMSVDFLSLNHRIGSNNARFNGLGIPREQREAVFRRIEQCSEHIDKRLSGFCPSNPTIPFTEENRQAVYSALYCSSDTNFMYPGKLRYRSLDHFHEPIRSALRKLCISLDAYYESAAAPMDYSELVDLVLRGPEGVKTLKRIRQKALVVSSGSKFLEKPEWFDEVSEYSIWDIGEIFNYQYMLNWEEPDEEDWKYSQKPCSIKSKYIDEFKENLEQILPPRESFEKVDPEEILLDQTSAISQHGGNKAPHWQLQGLIKSFSNKPLEGLRTLIQTGPGTMRDTVILPIEQSNSVKLLDRQLLQIIRDIPGNGMFKDPLDMEEALLRDRKKFTYFINRDLKKEGLTKPRQLLHAMFEVLEEHYPDLELDKYRHIYDDFTIILENGTRIATTRGHGLGMCNSGTTLMQLVVHQMVKNRMLAEGYSQFSKISCKAYNDDFYSAFHEEEDSYLYHEMETDVMEDISLVRESKKSWEGTVSVLCENYSSPWGKKESYARREVLMALQCVNITHAKSYINALDKSINPEILELYLPEIISYWGYEFCRCCERRLPASCGGWISFNYRFVSEDALHIPECRHLKACFEAGQETHLRYKLPKPKLKSKFYLSPIKALFNIDSVPEEAERYFNTEFNGSLARKFTRLSNKPDIQVKAWFDLESKRKEIFGRWINEYDSPGNIEKQLILRNPTMDYIANWTALSVSRCKIEATDLDIKLAWEWCTSANPKIAYLKHLYPDKFSNRDVIGNPLPLLIGGKGKEDIDQRSVLLYHSSSITPSVRSKTNDRGINMKILEPMDDRFKNSYISPLLVASVLGQRCVDLPIPTVVPEEKKKFIDLRRKFEFSMEDLKLFWYIPFPLRWKIRDMWQDFANYHWEISEIFSNSLPKRVPTPIFDSDDESDPGDYEEDIDHEERLIEVRRQILLNMNRQIKDTPTHTNFYDWMMWVNEHPTYKRTDEERLMIKEYLYLSLPVFGQKMHDIDYLNDRERRRSIVNEFATQRFGKEAFQDFVGLNLDSPSSSQEELDDELFDAFGF